MEAWHIPETVPVGGPMFPPARDRQAWQTLPKKVHERALAEGEEYLGFAYPTITAADWMLFCKTGDRTLFEDKYFAKRHAVCALAIAECIEGEGRFLPGLLEGIFSILGEAAWQLPAHNDYTRGGEIYPWPNTSRPVLDLFACETGALLACLYYLLGDALDRVSPHIGQSIAHALRVRIIEPYLANTYWWMNNESGPTMNWTVWCTQNCLLTALLPPFFAKESRAVAQKAVESIRLFLAEYGEDGCCEEGAQYYRHAGLTLFNGLDILERAWPGCTKGAFETAKVKNIARYVLNMHVHDEYYVNFADCSPVAGRAGAREFLFGKRCGDNDLCSFAAADWRRGEGWDFGGMINLYYRAQSCFAAAEMLAWQGEEIHPARCWYKSKQVFVARNTIWLLAAKGGTNAESHNHNDVGSVTVYKNGKPFLVDAGVGEYTAKTFSPQRYELWTMQSSWHNLPEFDGHMQRDGAGYRAAAATVFDNGVTIDATSAWGTQSGLTSFRRTARLLADGVCIEDHCEGTYQSAVMNLLFCIKPALEDGAIVLPGLGRIAVEGGGDMALEEKELGDDAKLRMAWPEKLYRLRIAFANTIKLTLH